MIDKKLSFFYKVKSIETQAGLPKLHRHLSMIKRGGNLTTGSGFSIYKENSLLASMGEAVERYCASIKPLNIYTENNMNNKIEKININSITRASKEYDNTPNREWIEVTNILSRKKILVPCEMAYLCETQYTPIRDIISTGLATYSTINGAIIRGLCECIERDAFVLFWMLSCGRFKIDTDTIDQEEIRILFNKAYNSGLKIDVYDISTEFGVPVILTITKKSGVEGFYIACAANFDYNSAIRKALEEGLGGYSVYVESTLIYNKPIPNNLNNIKNLSDRPIYYLNNKVNHILDNIIERSEMYTNTKHYKDIKKEKPNLEQVINNLNSNNINVYYKDLTTVDVTDIGFKVVRVITPELAFLSTGSPMLCCDRLLQIAKRLDRNLNMEPHPFP